MFISRYSFVSSLVRSIFRPLFRSFVRAFVGSLVRWFVRAFVRSFVRSFIRSFVASPAQFLSFIIFNAKQTIKESTLHCEDSPAAVANFSMNSFIRKMSLKLLFVAALLLLVLDVDVSSGTFCDEGPPGRYCYKDLTGWYGCVYDSKTKTMNQTKHDCPANTRSVRELNNKIKQLEAKRYGKAPSARKISGEKVV